MNSSRPGTDQDHDTLAERNPEFIPVTSSARKTGTDQTITQYFFKPEAQAFYMKEIKKRDVIIPIYVGIMPVITFDNIKRFSENCGGSIPRWFGMKMEERKEDPDSRKDLAPERVSRLCQQLLDRGAPGIHLYALNQPRPSLRILDNLDL